MKEPGHLIRLNAEARSDIEWWFQFMRVWNSRAMLPPPTQLLTLVSNASGNWGCGTYWNSYWFQLQLPWNSSLVDTHISVKELAPIVLATAIWGKAWKGHTIRVLFDNTATVAAINYGTSTLEDSAHLLHCLAFLTAHRQCELKAYHLPGQPHIPADSLSSNVIQDTSSTGLSYSSTPPDAADQATNYEKPDWTFHHWTELWTAILKLA